MIDLLATLLLLGSTDPTDIFDMLDTDGGGEISVDEFCDQILKCVTSDRPMELERIMKLCKDLPRMRDAINMKVLKKNHLDLIAEEVAVKTIEFMQNPKAAAIAKHKKDKRDAKQK